MVKMLKRLVLLLQLKGKREICQNLLQFKGTPCKITIYYQLTTDLEPRICDCWMAPNWGWPELFEQTDTIMTPWKGYINSAGIIEINDLTE